MKSYTFSKDDTLCIKAIAIILMLIHHLFSFPAKLPAGVFVDNLYTFDSGKTLESIAGDFGKLCVALFMVLSGYGMYCSYKNSSNFNETIIKRIKNVYIKFWQVFFIFVPIGIIIGSDKIKGGIAVFIKNILAIDLTYNDEWWFLTPYIVLILLSPAIIKWIERKNANMWIDIILITFFNAVACTSLITLLTTNKYVTPYYGTYFGQKMLLVAVMTAMFASGCYLAKYDIIAMIRNRISSQIVAKLVGVLILIVTFLLRQSWQMHINWGWDRLDFIYACTFCIGCALILDGLTPVKTILSFIGKQATGMWLIHGFFCYYYCPEFIYAPQNPILIFLLLFAISFVFAYIINEGLGFLWKFLKDTLKEKTKSE